ncbi:MAG: acyl-CoA dehydrogenase [Gammaproteobacteria bacterium]|nr:acyl-CoA dehydrogenase [Gammaproteobacteria bacterium]MBU1600617.1 acyl-CoA dehydrogenase [Gammaproteobacteria bacterium]MBU2435073.1 acyl-CoA dehydrogenase [Gammaproteobacteria bacterium]MBU2448309.1 acyl-CoA dehydrogenase [Gammaproteobacteria bacterium]
MDSYGAPLRDMQFILDKLVGIDAIAALPGCADAEPELVYSILEEAGKFASGVLAPLNKVGDVQGCRLDGERVVTPEGWQEAWDQFVASGWLGLSLPAEYGGQGLPKALSAPVWEMWFAANQAFAMLPQLTLGQTEALELAASEAIKGLYLPKIVSGEWACNMSLTEPQAGSDLAAIRMRAEDAGDGSYRLFGQKIFISYGDHELAGNIVHLVLARLPDAPPGIKGISLFLVPKFLVNADGSLGAKNDVRAVSLEHKMGIHGSPTCTMAYGDAGGAVGYLVGELNRGIETMFVMMNDARFGVAIQGVGVAERAYQMALRYADERVQGRHAVSGEVGQPIARHAEVKRQLLAMRTRLFAMRALVYTAAGWFDHANHNPDAAVAERCRRHIDLLMPILKGWNTETGNIVCDDAIQVFGGMGFVEETGVAQHYRDSRVTRIYEGTTGIQAIDLVGRKILRDKGVTLRELLADIRAEATVLALIPDLAGHARMLSVNAGDLERAGEFLLASGNQRLDVVHTAAQPFLHLCGLVCAGWRVAQATRAAHAALAETPDNADYLRGVLAIGEFWFATYAPQVRAWAETVVASATLATLPESAFLA